MAQKIFISSASSEDLVALSDALIDAGFEPLATQAVRPGENLPEGIEPDLTAAALVLVVLPPVRSTWLRWEINQAIKLHKPIILISTAESRPPDADLREYINLRSDLRNLRPVIYSLQARLAHPNAVGAPPALSTPSFSSDQVIQWTTSVRKASVDRFERQVSMMLADAGVELSPPFEIGPDFVAWSDGLAAVFGNPFLIEIKRHESQVDESSLRKWLSRAGLTTLVLLLGSENSEVAVESTADGRFILHLPVVELIEALGERSFPDAVRTLAQRTGVTL